MERPKEAAGSPSGGSQPGRINVQEKHPFRQVQPAGQYAAAYVGQATFRACFVPQEKV